MFLGTGLRCLDQDWCHVSFPAGDNCIITSSCCYVAMTTSMIASYSTYFLSLPEEQIEFRVRLRTTEIGALI